jgi:uncharacterized protein (TIGR01244 family)
MSDFRRVTDDLSVAPQISVADVAEAARRGFRTIVNNRRFRTIVNNRPDDEDPGQPDEAEIAAAARAAGLAFISLPVRGGPTPDQVARTAEWFAAAEKPVLAYCRSGTRCIVTWSLSQAATGARSRDELIALGADAGYDLTSVLG